MSILETSKAMSVSQNVTFKVIDQITGKVVQKHVGHNCATNSMLTGIAHYLIGDGVLNQSKDTLSSYIPRYISLGTMGLYDQTQDESGLPVAIGQSSELDDETNCKYYMSHRPGYSADGYDNSYIKNNDRAYFGLGKPFAERSDDTKSIDCELISDSYPRSAISLR